VHQDPEPRSTHVEGAQSGGGSRLVADSGDTRLPQIGIGGSWFFDPFDRRTWSGIPANLIGELARMGMFGGYEAAMPPLPLLRATLAWLSVTGRGGSNQPTTPELRSLTWASNAVARRRRSVAADAWVVPAGGFGRPVSGRVLTLSEIAPGQLRRLGAERASAFGMPGLTEAGLSAVVRQQLALHRRSHACCVASSWAASALVEEHRIQPERVHVVGYGRNVDISPPKDRQWTRPRFLFVGNDWKRKNGGSVVRSFRRLHEDFPDARLDLVGQHPRVDVTGVTGHGRIGFDEPGGREQLGSLFAGATCFVMPSSIEPFGIVYVEAAAAGLASIGTTIGGTATSIGDGGLVVDPGDDEALYLAMAALCDPDRARALGRRAQARAEVFTWRNMAERIVRATGLVDDPSDLAGYL